MNPYLTLMAELIKSGAIDLQVIKDEHDCGTPHGDSCEVCAAIDELEKCPECHNRKYVLIGHGDYNLCENEWHLTHDLKPVEVSEPELHGDSAEDFIGGKVL